MCFRGFGCSCVSSMVDAVGDETTFCFHIVGGFGGLA